MLHQPFFIPAIAILLLAIPLILGLIPQNPLYGVRTVKTLADEQLWYQANKYGGWAFVLSSIFYLCIASVLPSTISGNTDFGRWLIHLASFVLPLGVSLLLIQAYLRRSQ